MKYVAEQGKANVQGVVEECKKIQYSPALNIDTPTGLLKKSFLNALFLALRGANGQGFDVNIPQSKTNQRGINGSLNDEKLRIPYHPMIMETYNKYFSKRPGNADKEFYLREYVAEDDNDQMEGSDKQALTPIELQSTFTNAREVFKAKINQKKPNSIF
ncbi:hypothetical protein RhiirA4_428101 [Rhizophagus irregularis]|uniref:Uncharacterized protein n=1 Tax=Rhizophagus irregularis TaxID=588596 RepID=A0A2I1HBJ2_9GLOM|nr:hypothetical protein RhiirA4_428101 [Rhizophagus irregularis]